MSEQVLISFFCADRPGRVERLSELFVTRGGNWRESQLSRLGGRFAGVILLQLPGDQVPGLAQDLAALEAEGITAQLTSADGAVAEVREQRCIRLLGPDRSGIVRELTHALRACGCNVLDMKTRLESAPMSGELLFAADATVELLDDCRLDVLEQQLDDIAERMTLHIDLE